MNVMNWQAVAPEIVLLVLACAVTLVDLFVKDSRRRPTYWLTMLGLAAVAGLHLGYFNAGQAGYAMNRMLVSDQMGHLLAFFATVSVGVTLVYGQHYAASREILKGELFSLSLFSLLGISIMVAGNHLLVLYLGLEVMTLSLYAMVALRRDNLMATEAAMKYFVLGALSSGFLLYGLSMIYGATGSLSVPEIFQIVAAGEINKQVMASAWCSSWLAWRSSWARCRSTCGCLTSITAPRPWPRCSSPAHPSWLLSASACGCWWRACSARPSTGR